MIIEPPKTVQDFEKVEASILELMANPYCDHLMFDSLSRRLENVRNKIEELKPTTIGNNKKD